MVTFGHKILDIDLYIKCFIWDLGAGPLQRGIILIGHLKYSTPYVYVLAWGPQFTHISVNFTISGQPLTKE